MTEAPSWEPLSSVSELVEALMAWQTLDQLIHPSHYGTNVIVWIVKKVKIKLCMFYITTILVTLFVTSQTSVQKPSLGVREHD